MPNDGIPTSKASTTERLTRQHAPTPHTSHGSSAAPTHLILIGASAGGHLAIKEVMKGLSSDLPATVILIRHLPTLPPSTYGSVQMEDWLRDVAQAPVRVITQADSLKSGVIYLTPPGMGVTLDGQRFHLVPYGEGRAPLTVINALFESAAREYGNRVIGVILTGSLSDGTVGLRAVQDAGGLTIVQNPDNAEYASMPKSAMSNLPVTFCLNLAEIGPALDLLVRRTAGLETGLAASVRMLKARVALLTRLMKQSTGNEQTLTYLSTELQQLKRDLKEIQALVNHAAVQQRCGGRREART